MIIVLTGTSTNAQHSSAARIIRIGSIRLSPASRISAELKMSDLIRNTDIVIDPATLISLRGRQILGMVSERGGRTRARWYRHQWRVGGLQSLGKAIGGASDHESSRRSCEIVDIGS